MANKTAISPYIRLRQKFWDYVSGIVNRKRVSMFDLLQKDKSYSMSDVWHRTMAAQACGHSVEVVATENGLLFQYVSPFPLLPASDLV